MMSDESLTSFEITINDTKREVRTPRMRKIVKPWLREDTIRLIRLYEKHPILWDCARPDYRHRAGKSEALQEIATELDREEDDCKNKWNNLRVQYNNELRKIAARKAGGNGSCWSRWEYFPMMKFMKACLQSPNATVSTSQNEQIMAQVEQNSMDNTISYTEYEPIQPTPSSSRKRKREHSRSLLREQRNFLLVCTEALRNVNSLQPTMNEEVKTDTFGAYISDKLKNITDDTQRLYTENLITQVIFKAIMNKLTPNTVIVEQDK